MRTFGPPLGNIHDFSSKEAQDLLHNKFVVVIGDSIYRSIYKDLVSFLQKDEMLNVDQLRTKGEESFANDYRVEFSGLHPGTDFYEVRQYRTSHHLVRFYFITRIYSSYMESILNDFKAGVESDLIPDVVIINSCLWDLNRYHAKSTEEPCLLKAVREYRQNLEKLFAGLDGILPSGCLVIWDTAMPIGNTVTRKSFKNATPVDVIQANFYSASLACCYKFDVLDLHYCFRFLEQHIHTDGVHWSYWVHRCVTKLLLTHVADAWGVELEKRKPQTGIDWNGSTEDQRPSSRLPYPQVPRQPLPHANGSPLSQFNPSSNPFAQHNSSYGSRTIEGFEYEQQQQPPPYVQPNAYANGPGDGSTSLWLDVNTSRGPSPPLATSSFGTFLASNTTQVITTGPGMDLTASSGPCCTLAIPLPAMSPFSNTRGPWRDTAMSSAPRPTLLSSFLAMSCIPRAALTMPVGPWMAMRMARVSRPIWKKSIPVASLPPDSMRSLSPSLACCLEEPGVAAPVGSECVASPATGSATTPTPTPGLGAATGTPSTSEEPPSEDPGPGGGHGDLEFSSTSATGLNSTHLQLSGDYCARPERLEPWSVGGGCRNHKRAFGYMLQILAWAKLLRILEGGNSPFPRRLFNLTQAENHQGC